MKIPLSAYRLQLNSSFTFNEVEGIIDYLHNLGITHIYSSPVLKSKTGSTHGYDMTDFRSLNPEIGTLEQMRHLTEKLHSLNMGWIQDFVPNHMSYSSLNPFISDVMEKGRESDYSDYFDILWDCKEHPGVLCAPFLDEEVRDALSSGSLKLSQDGKIHLDYRGTNFPVSKESLIKSGISVNGNGRTGVDQLSVLNSERGRLEKLVSRQHYHLEHWKHSLEEINYRRFFSINDLIGMRVEDERVFNDVHKFLISLIHGGIVDGIRIDHIDGLREPSKYLKRLSDETGSYIVVEKILEDDERLQEDWDCQGTTGYDFLNALNQVFTMSGSAKTFDDNYFGISGSDEDYSAQLRQVKRDKLARDFSGDLENAVSEMVSVLGSSREEMREFVTLLIAEMKTYRTYITDDASEEDKKSLQKYLTTFLDSKESIRFVAKRIIDQLGNGEGLTELFGRLQQLTAPIMAKSSEDTMFFRYNRLVSLNEVGCTPYRFGYSIDSFHSFMKSRERKWKHSMNATSTHDTKMGEDARARISVLSEMPDEWFQMFEKWRRLNERFKKKIEGKQVPDTSQEYYLYQTMLGGKYFGESIGGSFRERITSQMIKASRESGVHTSWIDSNKEYEEQVTYFVHQITDEEASRDFVTSFDEFQKKISFYGAMKSLAELAVKLTSPGVPDIYQGSELWNFSLTDPDNRRQVDYLSRIRIMSEILKKSDDPSYAPKLLQNYCNGMVKMYLTRLLLRYRNNEKLLFQDGAYFPVKTGGAQGSNLLAFGRSFNGKHLLTIVPRFLSHLTGTDNFSVEKDVWGDTHLINPFPVHSFTNVITGEKVMTEGNRILSWNVLSRFPASVLYGES